MARAILCDSEDGQEAAVLISMVEDGQQLAWCGPCYVQFVMGQAAAFAEAQQQANGQAAETAATGPGEGGAAQSPPDRKRGRPRGPAAEAPAATAPAPDPRSAPDDG